MDCQHIREAMLDALDEASSPAAQRRIDAHVAGCPACAAFAAKQRALDARLSAALPPPSLSPAFRSTLRRSLRDDAPSWTDALPDIVHFASCGVATLIGAALVPVDPALSVGVGATAALLAYALLNVVRDSFEDVEQLDR